MKEGKVLLAATIGLASSLAAKGGDVVMMQSAVHQRTKQHPLYHRWKASSRYQPHQGERERNRRLGQSRSYLGQHSHNA